MAGRHAAKSTPKKPVIIVVVAVLAVAAVVAVALFLTNKGGSSDSGSIQPSTIASTTQAENTESATESQTVNNLPDNPPANSEQPAASDVERETEPIDIAIPTEEGSEISYFNASYIPNGEVIDLSTGESVTLRDVFGSTYPGGVLTFNDDGTFTDTISASGVDSGAYLVENGQIKATYVYDRNMDITVTEWNDDVPSAFYIIYGTGENGFKVFFSEN